jgi:hypothetical protein
MGSQANSFELMEENMKYLLRAGVAALALNCGVAMAQSATETTTTQYTAPVPPPPLPQAPVPQPPPGTLATTHTTRSVDAYGNEVDSQRTTYRTPGGVAQDSRTVTTTVPAPPPPVTTTTTTTQSTITDPN